MLLAQLSDLHVLAEGLVSAVSIDSNAQARRAVARLAALEPTPDAVLLTGDLTDNGTTEEFEHLAQILAPIEAPLFPVAGNHDERLGLRAAFPNLAEQVEGPYWQWEQRIGDLRLLSLDTTIQDRHDGELDDERLDWLDRRLAAEPDATTIVAMHHPPIRTGIWWMDVGGLRRGGDELEAVIRRHPQVRRVVCGHHHRSITTSWGPTIVSVAPSVSHLIHLDLVPESKPRFTDEPTGFHLHWVDGDQVVTHLVGIETPDTIDLAGDGWASFQQSLLDGSPMYKRR